MKKIKKLIKNNCKFVIGLVIGFVAVASIAYAVEAASSAALITYSNSSSGLSATTLQSAIDELWNASNVRAKSKFISAYTYNSSTCVTGDEKACVATTCYKTKSAGSCPAGTIINYKVNDSDIVRFHVMYDTASTITMQAQRNTVYNTAWITALDYSGSTICAYDKGPLTILTALESATAGWSNVEDQTYSIGDDTTTLGYSGCSAYNNCKSNTYTLDSRTVKSRMITVLEAFELNCDDEKKSCPKWMNNYLISSTSYGGTVNDASHGSNSTSNNGYWTMNASTQYANTNYACGIHLQGQIACTRPVNNTEYGARAVVVVSK